MVLSENNNVCRHWWRKGRCAYGLSCSFAHPPPTSLPPYPQRKYNKTYNAGRARVFRKWLLDTYDLSVLKGGSGVIDVAGGKGILSFELQNVHDIPCTVCDPRPLDERELNRCDKLWRNGFYHKRTRFTSDAELPFRAPTDEPSRPRYLKSMFHEDLYPGGVEGTRDRAKNLFLKSREATQSQSHLLDGSGAITHGDPDKLAATAAKKETISRRENGEIATWEEAEPLLTNVSMIIGMHPDGAAGAIVEFALRSRKPFALVPCCVFWKTFSDRTLADGTKVKKYEQLLDYLCELDPINIRRTVLPGLEGRNICLYRLPQSIPQCQKY